MATSPTTRFFPTALRTMCCAGAITACGAWASVAPWQLSPRGALEAIKDVSQPANTSMAQGGSHLPGLGTSSQFSFKRAPESGVQGELGAVKAAGLSEKLQARDIDYQEQAPSTIASSTGFNEQFVSVPNYQFVSMAPALAGVSITSTAGEVVPVPEMSALFPIVGLIVAVSCTRILRRRRAAPLSAERILV